MNLSPGLSWPGDIPHADWEKGHLPSMEAED